ncbi:hypothetical protein [uncultured Lutibacter sp.]|uniref:hypothetical protein n=1 Tax=uncultured Lutibacter sp. TaxID=437739 RepID=UPI002636B408|nr:hypothetical protein [uncultured Lutibacter sp.]
MKRKIAIIFWDGWLDVSPTLQYLINKLNEFNFEVDVFIKDDNEFTLDSINDFEKVGINFIRIKTINGHNFLYFFLYFLRKIKLFNVIFLNKIINKIILKILQKLEYYRIQCFAKAIFKYEKKFNLIFCVDAISLYLLDQSKLKYNSLYYLSLELGETPKHVSSSLKNKILSNEKKYFKEIIEYTIIQDTYRWKALKRHIGIESNKMLELPNSTNFINEIEKKYLNNFFLENFNLERDTKIVLSAGMISKNVCSIEIAEAIGNYNFKDKVKIIFHDRIIKNQNQAYLSDVILKGKNNLIISNKAVKFNELYKIFSSAHIGLAIYNGNISDNYKFMAGASGKLYQYLKFGLPVITSNLPGFKELVLENNIGLVITDPNEIPIAVEKIFNNYSFYRSNVLTVFNNKLKIDIFLNRIIEQINISIQ